MKVITIGNEKGGVGKTTTCVTIAAGLAHRGHRVLLIDADAQGHATRAVGMPKSPGLYNWLVRDADVNEILIAIPPEKYGGEPSERTRLYLIGSNVETRNIATSISDAYAIADRLDMLREVFDYVLVDTSPTPSLLHGAIYLATDYVVYPTLCEYWSFDGLAESMARRNSVGDVHKVKMAGIIPFRVRANTLEHSENLNKLYDQFGDMVWDPIPESIIWAEASAFHVPIFVHAPTHSAVKHAWDMVDRVERLP